MKTAIWALPILLALAGCGAARPAPPVTAPQAQAGRPDPASAANLAERRTFRSALLGQDVVYHLYVPDSRHPGSPDTYPVVYWLHGSGGYPPGVLQMLASRFHRAILEGRMPPAIVVFPDGFQNTMWANAADGRMPAEDVIVRELVPHVDATYPTRADAAGRLLEGASMGGYGAARLGLRYPDVFGAISMINPGPMQPILDPDNAPLAGRVRAQATLDNVFAGDPQVFRRESPWQLAEGFAEKCARSPTRLILGENDPTMPTNMKFARRLEELGIAVEITRVADSGHDPRAMFANLQDDYWAFFGAAFARRAKLGCP